MATVHVTTVNQFLSVVTVNGNIVEVDSDLDFNGISTYPLIRCKQINGNGHSFYNIQSTNTNNILIFNATCTINRLAFKNILQTAIASFTSSSDNLVTFSKCTFSGYYGRLASGRVTFDKCGVNMQRCLGRLVEDSNGYVPELIECYIHCDLYSNISNGTIVGTSTYRGIVANCYFSGNVANLTSNAVLFNLSEIAKNNVFNVDITSNTNITMTYVYGGSSNRANVSLCNSGKIGSNINVTYGNVTPLTDAELKTPADVIATGFPLIG